MRTPCMPFEPWLTSPSSYFTCSCMEVVLESHREWSVFPLQCKKRQHDNAFVLRSTKKHARFFGWCKCLPVITFKVMMLLQLSVWINFWSFKKQRSLPVVNSHDCRASIVNIDDCSSVPYFIFIQFLSWLIQDIPVHGTKTIITKKIGD